MIAYYHENIAKWHFGEIDQRRRTHRWMAFLSLAWSLDGRLCAADHRHLLFAAGAQSSHWAVPSPSETYPPLLLELPPTPLFNKLPPSSSSCPLNSHSSCLSAVLRITIWASVPLNWGTAFDPNRPKLFDKKFPKPLSKVNSRSGYFIIWTSTNLK